MWGPRFLRRRVAQARSGLAFAEPLIFVVGLGLTASLVLFAVYVPDLEQSSDESDAPVSARPPITSIHSTAELALPVRIEPRIPRVALPFGIQELTAVAREFWPRRGADLGVVLHALHAFEGWDDLCNAQTPDIEELRAVLLDHHVASKWYAGRFVAIRTRFGMRYVTAGGDPAGQSHIDQVVATLAGLHLPLDHSITVADGKASIADFMRDSTENFQLRGEFEWSTLALARYHPSPECWKNRFGEEFDFDRVAAALIARPFDSSSCLGTHRLFALAILLHIDDAHEILSDARRAHVSQYLRNIAMHVASAQLPDGSIDPLWHVDVARQPWLVSLVDELAEGPVRQSYLSDTYYDLHRPAITSQINGKVTATGHHLEWLMLLPSEQQPREEFYTNAAIFLWECVKNSAAEDRRRNYCPYMHAIRVLKLFTSVTDSHHSKIVRDEDRGTSKRSGSTAP